MAAFIMGQTKQFGKNAREKSLANTGQTCHPTNKHKKGVEFKGSSLSDGLGRFDRFGGSGEHLACISLVLQNARRSANYDGCDSSGGYGGLGVVTATPLNSTPLFRHPDPFKMSSNSQEKSDQVDRPIHPAFLIEQGKNIQAPLLSETL